MGARLDGVATRKRPAVRVALLPARRGPQTVGAGSPIRTFNLEGGDEPCLDGGRRRSDMTFEAALGVEQLCTICQIAQRAELGAATPHRARKNSRQVHPETRRLVLDTVCLLNEAKIARAARFVGS